MTKKIIIYNSFTRDGHTTLLQRQLVEVNKELLTCKANDKKALINERKLLQRQLRVRDNSDGLNERIAGARAIYARPGSPGEKQAAAAALRRMGVDPESRSSDDRYSVKAYYEGKLLFTRQYEATSSDDARRQARNDAGDIIFQRHSIVNAPFKFEVSKASNDSVGTPEEQAYGEGFHSQLRSSPYSEENLSKAWERGKKAAELKNKLRKNSYTGGVRGQRFQEPHVRDFRSERGYVAKIINTAKGSVIARSEPMISEASAKKWAAEQAPKYRTMRTKAEFEMVFYDPERV